MTTAGDRRTRRSRARSASAAIAIALALASSCTGDDVAGPGERGSAVAPRVTVWALVDTLRADALGCYGNRSRGEGGAEPSPHIDALARDGIRFERAYSTAPWTVPSLVSQFTGLWPFEHGALRVLEPLATPAETIAERYRAAGARTAGVMTNFIAKGELGFSRGFERWDESLALGHEGSTGSAAVAKLLAFADELLAEKERTPASLFLFALLFEPHYRYEDQPGPRFGPGYSDDRSYVGALTGDEDLPDLRRDRARLGADDIAFLRGRYQSEVSRVDRAIGELVAGLKARGLYDDALFVVTSDHGEEIMDRSWIGHTRTLFEELVRVPLVVRLPARAAGPAGSVVESPVSLVDLASTLLDLDGLAADGQGFGRGRSFRDLALERGPAVRRYLYLHSDFEPPLAGDAAAEKRTLLWGVLDAEKNLKWIVDRHPERAPSGMLFDLGADPGETYDVSGEREVPAGMRQLEALDLEQGP